MMLAIDRNGPRPLYRQIIDEVREQKREQALGDYLDGLRSKATVEEV